MEQKKSGTLLWAALGIVLVILIGCLAYILVVQYNDYKADGGDSLQVESTDSIVPPTAAPTEPTTEAPTEPVVDDPAVIEQQALTVFQAAVSAHVDIVSAGTNTLPAEADFFAGTDAEGIGAATAQKLGSAFDPALITVYASADGVEWVSYDGHIYSEVGGFIG